MKPEDMRSLTIDSDLESLKKLNDWTYEAKQIEGMDYHLLKSNTEDIEIFFKEQSKNNICTSNILPQDTLDCKPKLKDDHIMKLAKSLEQYKISYSINVSENDIKELLNQS